MPMSNIQVPDRLPAAPFGHWLRREAAARGVPPTGVEMVGWLDLAAGSGPRFLSHCLSGVQRTVSYARVAFILRDVGEPFEHVYRPGWQAINSPSLPWAARLLILCALTDALETASAAASTAQWCPRCREWTDTTGACLWCDSATQASPALAMAA